MKLFVNLASAVLATAIAGSANAAVSAEEAKQLGTSLTAWGAEKAGNKEGTIPAYVESPIKTPADWNPKEPGRMPDPFRDEKPLFSITAQNAAQYADKLDGLMTLFKKYPNYRMDVYPTHRTMVYPKYVLDNTLKNATQCKGLDGEVKLDGCYGGVPFPIPKTGAQVVWNHLTGYETHSYYINVNQVLVPNSGPFIYTNQTEGTEELPFYDPKIKGAADPKSTFWRVRLDFKGPPRQVGEKLVLIDLLNPLTIGRRAYQYIPGQRRVKLAPDLAYDTPSIVAGGAATMDDAKVFIGAIDRYDWKLVGKKEKFIPYNGFKLTDYKTCPEDKFYGTKHFPNPDCVRWELHRVWVVEATVKPEFRHIYPKRRMFYDEDAFAGGVMENYDAKGDLFRVVMANPFPLYDGQGWMTGIYPVLDLIQGTWSSQGGGNFPGGGYWPIKQQPEYYFSPEALAGEGIR